jgi:hypothetical protein
LSRWWYGWRGGTPAGDILPAPGQESGAHPRGCAPARTLVVRG